jgi:peptidoglycan hydrolase-like protein with peptidoglycan-binding domain
MKNKFLGALIVLYFFMVLTTVQAASLRKGSQGNAISTLQQLLINQGYLKVASPTGYFGSATRAAVIMFQKTNGLTVDGVVGPKTLALLNSMQSITTTVTLQLTNNDNGKTISVAKGGTIAVTLCNPGDGGYQFDPPQYDNSILQLTSHKNIPINNPPGYVGGCYGNDVFGFQALATGTSKLNITASRSFESNSAVDVFSCTVNVQNTGNNTNSSACIPNWQCGWGPCIIPPCVPGSNSVACTNGTQSQVAVDSNNCGVPSSNVNIACPALARICNQ